MKLVVALWLSLLMVSCAGTKTVQGPPAIIGPWKNKYQGDPRLAGVIITQYPEGLEPWQPYVGKHPDTIWYVFWNGDIEAYQYSPDGKEGAPGLWKHEANDKGTKWVWNEVDYRFGSDPNFKRHHDPRTNSGR